MKKKASSTLSQMVKIIVKETSPEKIILFGSQATRKVSPNSDIDLLIVESEPFGPTRSRRREMTRIWKALVHFALPKDILVYSHDEVEYWQSSVNHIIGRALREGRILYERS